VADVKRDHKLDSRKLTIGDSFTATVVFIKNPEDFYIKIECTGFDILMNNINELCTKTDNSKRYNIYKPFKVGDICLARYSEDDSWYRSQVSKIKFSIIFLIQVKINYRFFLFHIIH